mgnify:CR=1 FL=1
MSSSWVAESRYLHGKIQSKDEEIARLKQEVEDLKRLAIAGESHRAEALSLQSKVTRLNQELADLPAYKESAARSDSFKAENQFLQVPL